MDSVHDAIKALTDHYQQQMIPYRDWAQTNNKQLFDDLTILENLLNQGKQEVEKEKQEKEW